MDKLVWFEIIEDHILNDDKPSIYFNQLIKDHKFPKESPYNMIYQLIKINQEPKHHPEGNVWNHTFEVVDLAAQYRGNSRDKRVFMWAALLHDLGKVPTTKVRRGRITAYDHDREGAKLANQFLLELTDDSKFIEEVVQLVRWHMQPLFVYKDLPFAKVGDMVKGTSVSEIALLSFCDRLGRGPVTNEKKKEIYGITLEFLRKCKDKVVDEDELEAVGRFKIEDI